jgi:hypothetical protein
MQRQTLGLRNHMEDGTFDRTHEHR